MKTTRLFLGIFLMVLFSGCLKGNNNEPSTPNPTLRGAYTMPYLRYDSQTAVTRGNVFRESAPDFDPEKTASQASNQEYVTLLDSDASVSWTVSRRANGLTVRFTLPDDPQKTGAGSAAELGVYVNDRLVKKVPLTSYWSYQYFNRTGRRGVPFPQWEEGRFALMCFDEKHFLLDTPLEENDVIALKKLSGEPLGIDFIELEWVDGPLSKPSDALSVTDFGAVAGDGKDDLQAFKDCILQAHGQGRSVYVPEGEFTLSDRLLLDLEGTRIQGAGMWYTTLFFSNPAKASGGIRANAGNLKLSHLHFNTINSTRMDDGVNRGYHCISGTWRDNSSIEYIWEDHFTAGMWIADYQGNPITQNFRVSHVRLRNNYADGVNFANGTSRSVFQFSDVRNCGDDGIASFSSTGNNPVVNRGNTFRWCTVEFGWRAGGVGIFGGGGHRIHNLYIGEHIGSAGIRFTSDFPSYDFDPADPMKVYDCTVYKCGARSSLYGQIYASLEFHGKRFKVRGIEMSDIDVVYSQVDGVRLVGDNIENLSFKNIRIDGTGKDGGQSVLKNGLTLRGYGIFTQTDTPEGKGSARFENIIFEGCADDRWINVEDRFDLEIK